MRVLAIFGPTASGKTDVAEEVADRIDGELLSADAMQVYDGLPILTNQSPRPTHLVAIWPLSHDASLAVREGLATTGRVITAAAAIMIVVFSAFIRDISQR